MQALLWSHAPGAFLLTHTLDEKIRELPAVRTPNKKIGKKAIECLNLWKVFGARAAEALKAVQAANLCKDEALERFGCVIGVADASFTVWEREIFCIMGLSGSGKSTVVRHINRLIEPTAGKVIVSGQDVMSLTDRALRELRARKIGMVFQHVALWPHKSIAQNVSFPLEVQGRDMATAATAAEEALSRVGLSGWGQRYPDELSGGMQQRVGLARAMAADPEILLMDEPFSALDPLIRRDLQNEFLRLSHENAKTTVFITHDLEEAMRVGNRIAIMKDGRIEQIGTPEEIVLRPETDYVARFVSSISTLKFLSALEILRQGDVAGDMPVRGPRTPLPELLALLIEGAPHVIIRDGNKVLGRVGAAEVISALQGDLKRG
ncbi:glycine betaine transporter subunit; ATP-binding compoent of ABC superfamily [Mesorhizobium plurifarium]|uniref:Quaternary amine transport ATP-binding protein n=1 Tax=Mesorhizobium plurifarium TaxID=69974 RepID=A0A090ECJ0_MESPL|nr:glycine betaine transporter subunit; ATP-binding compoent of ABC superfamily [Mesorhizobium plurifarium]